MIRYIGLLFLFISLNSKYVFAEEQFEIVGLSIEGGQRTDPDWVASYLQIKTPILLSRLDCRILAFKLMTTNVFTSVKEHLRPAEFHRGAYILVFEIKEKWTTIPVIRGAIGGGTPLRVFGIYDTHVFGSLWTLGAETRKYGDAKNGFTIWARSPRWKDGRHYLSAELWSQPRIRNFYDENDEPNGHVLVDSKFIRLEFLRPNKRLSHITQRGDWRYGLRLDLKQSKPEKFVGHDPIDHLSQKIARTRKDSNETQILLKAEYDDIRQDNLVLDGLKIKGGVGPIYDDGETSSFAEAELFYFRHITHRWQAAFHLNSRATKNKRASNLKYLGGLDSIRGHPDSVLFGNHSAHLNSEIRVQGYKGVDVHVQGIVFHDIGGAGFQFSEIESNRRSSFGVGVRLGSPKVYRLVLRIDYAWSPSRNNQGLSIGLNQFFQPYKPL